MTHIIFDDRRIELDAGQNVLTALLEHGYAIPNNCRAGACQTCLMQALQGTVPLAAQAGLKDTLKAQGYFLACRCVPLSPLRLADVTTEHIPTTVIDHTLLGTDILRLRLQVPPGFAYRAGQYITLWKDAMVGRSYSLASVAELDAYLELHIRRIAGGLVSNWLHDAVQAGDTLSIQAASGNCFYLPDAPDQPILLAGTGTGLAPLIGIARDALRQGHRGDIHLIHGTRQAEDLYLHPTLLELAQQQPRFHYHASVLQGGDEIAAPISSQPLEQQIMALAGEAAAWRIYLCGDAEMVNRLKKQLFLAGAAMGNIYSDPFVSAAAGQDSRDSLTL